MADVKIPFNLTMLFVALVALVIIGVLGFHFIEGWTFFDGFYMVLTTITSIGQETHGSRDQPAVGPLHHLRSWSRGAQCGARTGAQTAAVCGGRYQRSEVAALLR